MEERWDEPSPNSDDSSDFAKLLKAARNGDDDAESKLMERYRDYLLFLANQKISPHLQAKFGASDVVQQSLLVMHQQLPAFRGQTEAEFRGWVRAIVHNHLLNNRRHFQDAQRRRLDQEVRIGDASGQIPSVADPRRTPQGQAILNELAAELDKGLAALSPAHQQVLRLRNWEEKSFVEIGQTLEVSPDAARKLWYRAFCNLQEIIQRTRPEFASHLSALSTRGQQPED